MYRLIAEEGKTRFRRGKDGAIYKWASGNMVPEEKRGWSPFIGLNEEWFEVEQPVPFTVAFNALCYNKKDIMCRYNNEEYLFYGESGESYKFDEDLIDLGEWYILW